MLKHLAELAAQKLALINSLQEFQQVKVEFLGRQSQINQAMSKLGQLSGQARKEFGQEINQIKQQLQSLFDAKYNIIEVAQLNKRFSQEALDLSIAARAVACGSIHPITQCLAELTEILNHLGFTIKDGPSIESDWYNFTALNFSEHHPARQMHDTFYLRSSNNLPVMLRTHTSPVQIRTMENHQPPFRIIAPGRVYRSDSDMTHAPMFHQMEGLLVDKNIHMGHLKYVINNLISSFFEHSSVEIQFRPSFFPFTEPSVEVDIRLHNDDKWLEVLGGGMVHPNVLRNVGIDADCYQGLAFGLGIERFAMLKYGIKDLRQFFEGDMRWLRHYGFSAFDVPSLVGGLSK